MGVTPPDLTDRHLRLAIAGGALTFFVSSVGAALFGNSSGAGVLVVGLALCLVFLFLSRFKRFKGFGLEAETWEDKMDEADRVIARLDHLAMTMAEITYRQLSRSGHFGAAFHACELQRYVDQLDKTLLDAGIDAERIEELKRPVHRINMFDIFSDASKEIWEYLEDLKTARREPMKKFSGPLGQEAQKVQRDVIVRCATIDKLQETIKNEVVAMPLSSAPDRVEAAIKSNSELTGDEKIHLLELVAAPLELMRRYNAHKRWPTGATVSVE